MPSSKYQDWNAYFGKADAADIANFEILAGWPLPNTYKDFVKEVNGAYLPNPGEIEFFSNFDSRAIARSPGMILPFGGVSGNRLRGTETVESKWLTKPADFPEGLVIFAQLGNGDALCFDYRSPGTAQNPPIIFWHHEAPPGSTQELSWVANSFADLLRAIKPSPPDEIGQQESPRV